MATFAPVRSAFHPAIPQNFKDLGISEGLVLDLVLRRMLIEAPLCGTLALAASHGLALLGIPTSTAPFFGGVIGLLGVEGTRAAAKRFFNRKVEQL